MPVGYRRGIGCHDLVPDAPDGRFRRPAQRYQPKLGFQPAQLLDDHGLDVITALRDEPERAELVATMAGQEHLKNRRHRAPQRNAVFGHQLVPADRILFLAGFRQHQCRTGGKRPKTSKTDMSWCKGVTEMKTSFSVTAHSESVLPMTLAVALLESTTHFGLPVVPEV